jgi:hypothetical protein
MAKKKGTWDISIEINGKEVKNNLKAIGGEIGKLNGQIKNLQPGTEEFIKKSSELKKAQKSYKEINDEVRGTNVSLEEAQGHFSNLFGGLLSGNFTMIQQGLSGIGSNIKGMTASALKFIATPFGAVLTVLAGIAGATKLWADFNIELYKTTKITQQLTGLNGEMLANFRDDVAGTAKMFDKDYNEVLKSANSLAKQMGISHSDAIGLITKGFVKGADVNGDFLDKIREYPVQFRNAGYSAEEFIKIATQEAKGGVYSDKLLDTLKEADLALKEMTKTQTAALENAFGAKFTSEISKGISSGELTTKQALERIIVEADKVGLNFQQKQELLADVFKGAGEDAGGFDEIVKQLNLSFDEQNNKLTAAEEATARLTTATQNQNKALADLFDASQSGFPEMLTDIQSIGKEIFTNFLRGIKASTTSMKQLISTAKEDGSNNAVADVVEDMKRFGSSKEDAIKYKLETTQKNIDRIKKQISEVGYFGKLLGDDMTLQTQFSKYISYKNELLKIADETSAKFKDAEAEYINPDDPIKTDPLKTQTKKDKLTPEDKAILDSKKKLAEFLADFEADQELQNELKKFEKSAREEEEEVLRLEAKYQKMAEDAGFETILAAGLEDAHQFALDEIRNKYAAKKLTEKQKNDAEFEKLDQKHKDALIAAEQDLENAKANMQNSGFGLLKSLFGKKAGLYKLIFGLEKAMAVSHILVESSKALGSIAANTAAANMKAVLASPLTGGLPFTAINTALGVKQALTTKINAGVQIASIVGSSLSGFYNGGETGTNTFSADKNGGITGFTHKNEYVVPEIIRQDPTYAPIINKLENARAEKLGIQSTATNTADESSETNKMLTNAIYMLTNKLSQPIYATALIGDAEIQRQKERGTRISNSRNNAKVKIS